MADLKSSALQKPRRVVLAPSRRSTEEGPRCAPGEGEVVWREIQQNERGDTALPAGSSCQRHQQELATPDAHPEWRAVRQEAYQLPVAFLSQVPHVQHGVVEGGRGVSRIVGPAPG